MRFAANIAFIVLATWATQQLAITLRFPGAGISAFWTAYAVALAALLVFPPRRWPVVLAAVFAGLLIGHASDSVVGVRGLLLSYPLFVTTLVVGAWTIPRLGGEPLFGTLRSMLVFIAVALCMPMPVAAVLAPAIAGDTHAASQTAPALYLAVAVGTLAATPAFTALLGDVHSLVRIRRPARLLEAVSLGVLLLAVTGVAMGQPATSSVAPALSYAPLPLLIWAAGRFGPAGASWGLIAVGTIASWNAVRGRGPIVAAAGPESMLSLELSLLAIALPVLILAALARDRRRAETALRESEAALRGSHAAVDDLAARLITAQEAERTRIARELHDNANQKLAGISIALSDLRRHPQRHEALFVELARVQAAVNEVSREIRQLSHELHPGVLRHAGLVAALRSACDDLSRLHAAAITFVGKDTIGPLPDDVALCLYRVAQEALQNVVSHSGARRAQVSLARAATDIELTVTDDGRGFDTSDLRRQSGLGLISIHERVQLVHGTVHIEAHPRQGTVLRVRVPVSEPPIIDARPRPSAPIRSFSVETRAGR